MPGLVVFCADVGSVKRGRFGWARGQPQSDDFGAYTFGLTAR